VAQVTEIEAWRAHRAIVAETRLSVLAKMGWLIGLSLGLWAVIWWAVWMALQ